MARAALLLCTALASAAAASSFPVAVLWPPSVASSGLVQSGTPVLTQLNVTLPSTTSCVFCTRRWSLDNGTTCLDAPSSLTTCASTHWSSPTACPYRDCFFAVETATPGLGPYVSSTFAVLVHSPLAGEYCDAAYRLYVAAFCLAMLTAVVGVACLPIISCYRPSCCVRAGAAVKAAAAQVVAHYEAQQRQRAFPVDGAADAEADAHPLLSDPSCWNRLVSHVALAPATLLNIESSSWVIVFSVGGVSATCITAFVNFGSQDPFVTACVGQTGVAAASLIVALSAFVGACFKTALASMGVGVKPMQAH
jgi:hypothetical protein